MQTFAMLQKNQFGIFSKLILKGAQGNVKLWRHDICIMKFAECGG